MRDSVGGRALPCPLHYCSEGRWHLEHAQSCACRWGWLCGAHNKVGNCGPDLRVGDVVRVVCVGEGGSPQECVRWEGVQCSVSVDCVYVCPERGVLRNGGK